MQLFVLFAMIFCHIVDDYYLQKQGVLASMKQRQWWKENAPNKMYERDYIVALIAHAFSWSFMISIPLLFVSKNYLTICSLIILNTTLHAYVDNLKANKHSINLIQDQVCHLAQILGSWWFYICAF